MSFFVVLFLFVFCFRFALSVLQCLDLLCGCCVQWPAYPSRAALARSQSNSSSAFLIVFVVAAVPSDGAAACDCSNTAHAIKSRACLGFAFHVKPAGVQDRTRFTTWHQCPDHVQWFNSRWCALCAPTSLSRLETHRSSTPPWKRPRAHTHTRIVVIAQTLSFLVHIWLHRHCVPTSFHENLIVQKLLPTNEQLSA